MDNTNMMIFTSNRRRPAGTRMLPLLLSLAVAFGQAAMAGNYTSPDTIDGSTKIDALDLIRLASELDDLVIIDSRISTDRRQGFISGSISLPDTETNCDTLSNHVEKKTTPVVFYCNGPRCRRSDRAVIIARDCGYREIYWFRGGLEEWKHNKLMISK